MRCRSSLAARVAIAAAWVAVCACDGSESDGDGEASDGGVASQPLACDVEAPTSCPDPPVRYADVESIFQERCVICHVGARGGPWPLTTYKHVSDWHDQVRGVMLHCAMPPPDAGVPMTTDEREEILTWLRCGYPE